MYLKFLLVIIFGMSGGIIGYFLRKKDIEKELYFSELKTLATTFICEIKFSQETIGSIVENYESKSQLFNLHKKQYLKILQGEDICLEKSWLTTTQYTAVKNFFLNLGRYDSATQVFQIEAQMDKLSGIIQEIVERNKKQGVMKMKIGCLLGIGIGILIL